MPILGMGMMQFGGNGQRNVAILDYQPLIKKQELKDGHQQEQYVSKLLQIRSNYPSLQQPMTNRHFDPNEPKYFTANPIIGKWSSSSHDGNETNVSDSKMWKDLQTLHQDCIEQHVQMTQTMMLNEDYSKESETDLLKLHSDYDTFVAAKEPASQLLGSSFGKDIAHRLVHEMIFPLSTCKQQL
jgi:hypothetical protein